MTHQATLRLPLSGTWSRIQRCKKPFMKRLRKRLRPMTCLNTWTTTPFRLYRTLTVKVKWNFRYCFVMLNPKLCFLPGVVMEGLRLYPIGHLSRVCVKEYTFKDVGVTVKPGTQVMVPSITMMRYAQVSTQPFSYFHILWEIDT